MKLIKKLIKTVFLAAVIIWLAGMLVLGYAFFVEPHRLNTVEIEMSDENITDSLTVAFFTDTHFGYYTPVDFQKASEAISEADPDIILFGGDLFDNFSSYKESEKELVLKALSSLEAEKGKYAVFGNHDYGGGAENRYVDFMQEAGFTVLRNDQIYINDYNVTVTGVDDFLLGYGDTQIAENLPADTCNIVLCHEPDIFDRISDGNVDLMLSGHSHGGQINIPFIRHSLMPPLGEKYIRGKFTSGDSSLYVNPGLGTTSINARLLAVPEVTIVTVDPE